MDPDAAADEDDVENAALRIAVEAAVADHQTTPLPSLAAAHPQLQALAAVRGTDFGNAVHAVFEHRAIGGGIRIHGATSSKPGQCGETVPGF